MRRRLPALIESRQGGGSLRATRVDMGRCASLSPGGGGGGGGGGGRRQWLAGVAYHEPGHGVGSQSRRPITSHCDSPRTPPGGQLLSPLPQPTHPFSPRHLCYASDTHARGRLGLKAPTQQGQLPLEAKAEMGVEVEFPSQGRRRWALASFLGPRGRPHGAVLVEVPALSGTIGPLERCHRRATELSDVAPPRVVDHEAPGTMPVPIGVNPVMETPLPPPSQPLPPTAAAPAASPPSAPDGHEPMDVEG
ncbi:splicing factor 1-like [Schistocerca gregaria]|uniref:splicing factor 1-like n=1 Tax=Schistocerca gregaria TaxID=7010 RepID=UPI00211DE521|nr:splicing factor 1-like [Schistocerca gregaria]